MNTIQRSLLPILALLALLAGCASTDRPAPGAETTATPAATAPRGPQLSLDNVTDLQAANRIFINNGFDVLVSPETAVVKEGSGAMKVEGITKKNQYGNDFNVDVRVRLEAPQDLSYKTVTAWVNLPAGSPVSHGQIALYNGNWSNNAFSMWLPLNEGWNELFFDVPAGKTDIDQIDLILIHRDGLEGPVTAVFDALTWK